jgi:hypothetical protein
VHSSTAIASGWVFSVPRSAVLRSELLSLGIGDKIEVLWPRLCPLPASAGPIPYFASSRHQSSFTGISRRISADFSPKQVHRGCESERNLLPTRLFSNP